MKKRFVLCIPVAVILLLAGRGAFAWTTAGDGIEYQSFAASGPNNVFVSRMARSNTNATIDSAVGYDSVSGATEIVRNQAARQDGALSWWGGSWGQTNSVRIAVNGGYWSWATSVMTGGQIQNGWYVKWHDDMGAFSGFAWKTDRTPFIGQCVYHNPADNRVYFLSSGSSLAIKGINRARGGNELIVYTPQYDNQTPSQSTGVEVLVEMAKPNVLTSASTYSWGYIRDVKQNSGSTWIPFDHVVLSAAGDAGATLLNNSSVGGAIRIYQQLTDKNQPTTSGTNACQTNTGQDWQNTFAGINANYHFLENNAIRSPDPNYDGYAGMIIRNPRTAICYNADYVFFVVCDGRSTASVGWTSDEMATFCKNTLGATDGVNCDGGGSSTMVVNGVLQNVPSDGSERPTVNSMMMVNIVPKSQTQTFASGQTVTVASSANVRLGPGTNYGTRTTVSAGATGTVQSHALNGVAAKGYNWWKVSFSGTVGWIGEALLVIPASPPVITQQPASTSVCSGGTATFRVVASGSTPRSYQWRKGTADITEAGHYSGTTTTTLTVSTCDSGDVASNYSCYVTNAYGSIASNSVSLAVNAVPAAPTNPAANPSTITVGESSTLSATVGSGETVDWYAGSCNGSLAGSGTSFSVSPTSTTAYYPRARTTTSGCASASCGTAVTVTAQPGIELLTNGGFETCSTSGWTVYSRTSTPTLSTQTTGVSCGTCYLYEQLTTLNTAGGVRQTVTGLINGATYTISGARRSVHSDVTVSVKADTNGGTDYSAAEVTVASGITLTGVWSTFSVNVTATGTAMTVFLDSSQSGGSKTNHVGAFDCVSLTGQSCSPTPTAPTSASASPGSICSGASSTLTASGGSGSTCAWYTGSCGGTLIGTGTSIGVAPTSTTTYYALWMNACGSSTCASTSVTVNAIPAVPADGSPTPGSTTGITWKWTDVSGETGYRVKDTAGTNKSGDLAAATVQWAESSLSPNTQYTRKVYSFGTCGESAGSTGQAKYTLAKAGESTDGTGSTGNVYCTSASKSTWYAGSKAFVFSNPAGFGTGGTWKASSFEYKWNKTATETWSTAGTSWTSSTVSLTTNAGDGDYYLHVRAFNGDGVANSTDVVNYGPFRSDATAPSTVTVTDEGTHTPSQNTLKASWTASTDTGSGIKRYDYAIGTSSTTQGIRGWTSAGTSTTVSATGLALTDGTKYYVQARAVDNVDNLGTGAAADGITVVPGVSPISYAWPKANASDPLSLRNKVVTAALSGAFWLEETNRTMGIKVVSGASVTRGNTVSVAGVLGLSGTQRALIGDVVVNSGGTTTIKPLAMNEKSLGGGAFNASTPGITGSGGLYNIGLLVKVFGNVTYSNTGIPSDKYFYLDDGSGLSRDGNAGVLVRCGSVTPPSSGMRLVTGIVASEQSGSSVVPVILIRDSADVAAP